MKKKEKKQGQKTRFNLHQPFQPYEVVCIAPETCDYQGFMSDPFAQA
ncbi:MAG: hypothetical protein PHT62_06540 [Desulfotomaculaceae bacterium]|nr:hypothetical protein [Desulfotomaculaceae bacterium]